MALGLPDKAIKLLLCNSCKTVSMILLGISEQRLSFSSSAVRQRSSSVLRPVSPGRDADNAGSHAYVSSGGIQETTVPSPQTAVNRKPFLKKVFKSEIKNLLQSVIISIQLNETFYEMRLTHGKPLINGSSRFSPHTCTEPAHNLSSSWGPFTLFFSQWIISL